MLIIYEQTKSLTKRMLILANVSLQIFISCYLKTFFAEYKEF